MLLNESPVAVVARAPGSERARVVLALALRTTGRRNPQLE